MRKQFIAFCALAALAQPLATFAQQQGGNVVEYFGKERVERIDEGVVLHQFTEGYYVPVTTRRGMLFTTQDELAWELAKGKFNAPTQDNLIAQNYGLTRQAVNWQPIAADSTGKFTSRDLRNSYLYTSFNADKDQVVLLEAGGPTRTFINGMPHEGDHYDFAYTLTPFVLKKGQNDFIYTHGRFGRVTARLIVPKQAVMLTQRDMTLPDIINGETDSKWAAIRVINTENKALSGLRIECTLPSGEKEVFAADEVMPMSVRKLKFKVPASNANANGEVRATVKLIDKSGKVIDTTQIALQQRNADTYHERTFLSNVDKSVQYYSVAPSTTKGDEQALFLTVHGASVEARNQARAYAQKDWGHMIAATNRRPFGFNWEEWGRIDAMEVLADAKRVFKTKDDRTYLTGHSMGGHGTWYLGVTYPDQFAAIAPCASYPDIAKYSRPEADKPNEGKAHFGMIERGAQGGRTLDLKRNYLQSGVYILHGDSDSVVKIDQARRMRQELGEFHTDFCYYEYPGGSHWYSNESVDWKPIFEFFNRHSIPADSAMNRVEFYTASPAISATNHWLRIDQQQKAYQVSNVLFDIIDNSISGTTNNVEMITFETGKLASKNLKSIIIDGQTIALNGEKEITLKNADNKWTVIEGVPTTQKYAQRSGGFKQAFDNDVVFVYATGGNKAENEWYRNKAAFDAETFLYRGNGSIDVIADTQFNPVKYKDRNVVVYGNASNNKAWNKLLKNAPIQVKNGEINFGGKQMKGTDLGTYFVYPRQDSQTASVGVVAGTGIEGMKAGYANDYISGITGFPDVLIFNVDMLRNGIEGVEVSGFFGNDWSISNGDFTITEKQN